MAYIYNAASDATGNADFNVQSYNELGIPASAEINVVQAVARVSVGASSASATNIAVRLVSNPAIAEYSFAATSVAADTEPDGWQSIRTAVAYDPVVTRGTRPVVRIGKRTATTRVAMADLAGVYIEYNDEVALAPKIIAVNQAVESNQAGEYIYLKKKTLLMNRAIEVNQVFAMTPVKTPAGSDPNVRQVASIEIARTVTPRKKKEIAEVSTTEIARSLNLRTSKLFIGG